MSAQSRGTAGPFEPWQSAIDVLNDRLNYDHGRPQFFSKGGGGQIRDLGTKVPPTGPEMERSPGESLPTEADATGCENSV